MAKKTSTQAQMGFSSQEDLEKNIHRGFLDPFQHGGKIYNNIPADIREKISILQPGQTRVYQWLRGKQLSITRTQQGGSSFESGTQIIENKFPDKANIPPYFRHYFAPLTNKENMVVREGLQLDIWLVSPTPGPHGPRSIKIYFRDVDAGRLELHGSNPTHQQIDYLLQMHPRVRGNKFGLSDEKGYSVEVVNAEEKATASLNQRERVANAQRYFMEMDEKGRQELCARLVIQEAGQAFGDSQRRAKLFDMCDTAKGLESIEKDKARRPEEKHMLGIIQSAIERRIIHADAVAGGTSQWVWLASGEGIATFSPSDSDERRRTLLLEQLRLDNKLLKLLETEVGMKPATAAATA